jgi:hypothetical protein
VLEYKPRIFQFPNLSLHEVERWSPYPLTPRRNLLAAPGGRDHRTRR